MDGSKFDDVARLMGTGASRRQVLKGFAAGLLGIGGMRLARNGVEAQDAQGVCSAIGTTCTAGTNECCLGLVCSGDPGICSDPTVCTEVGGPCNVLLGPICCGGRSCNATNGNDGSCLACVSYGNRCDAAENACCDGLTCLSGGVDDVCGYPCVGEGETCNIEIGIACCGDLRCNLTDGSIGTCGSAAPVCVGEGDTCGFPGGIDERNCCDGLVCNGDSRCEVPTTCQPVGAECDPHIIGQCCAGTCLPTVGDGPANSCQVACASVGDACSAQAGDGPPACCAGYLCTDGFCTEIPGPGCAVDGDCDPCNACVEGVCTGQCAGLCESCDANSGEHGTCVSDCRAAEGTGCCANGVTCNQETGICEAPADCASAADCATGTCCCNDGTCFSGCCPSATPTPDPTAVPDLPTPEPDIVTDLPKTGSGGSGGNGSLLGAALAAGTAALLAGAKLRARDNQG